MFPDDIFIHPKLESLPTFIYLYVYYSHYVTENLNQSIQLLQLLIILLLVYLILSYAS